MNPNSVYKYPFTVDVPTADPMPKLYPSDIEARLDMFEARMNALEAAVFPKPIKFDYYAEFFPQGTERCLNRELVRIRALYDNRRLEMERLPHRHTGEYWDRFRLKWEDYLEFIYDSKQDIFRGCYQEVYNLFEEQQKLYKLSKLQIN